MSNQHPQTTYHLSQDEETLRLFELRNAKTCLAYLLPTLQTLPSTFTLLDVGCGPASITFDLARLFPEAKIIGMDQDASVIERNNANISRLAPSTNISFRTGDILKPETFLSEEEIGGFDVVNEHTTLTCIPNNIEVLKVMKRIAKARGGLVASRNGDLSSQILHPACPNYEHFIRDIYKHNGIDNQTGRKLIGKALEVGWQREQIQPSASVMTTISTKDRQIWADSLFTSLADEQSNYSQAAKALGYDEDRLKVVKQDLQSFAEAQDGWRLLICAEMICSNAS